MWPDIIPVISYYHPGDVVSWGVEKGHTIWYLNSRAGKDEKNGRSRANPWKSPAKLKRIFPGLGVRIRFKWVLEFHMT
jgi:hypothetical protein